jgi:hypothetical protein
MVTPTPTPSFTIPILATSSPQVGVNQQESGKSRALRETSVDLALDNGEHVRLHDIFDPPLHATEKPPIKIKWQLEDQLDHLCQNLRWTPTTAVNDKIQEVAVMTWRLFEVEQALLAFVQHFDFIWEDGWILLGRKSAEEGFAHVWYKVVKLPMQTKMRFAQDADKISFTGSRDRILGYHASFICLLGESRMSNDRHTFMMGIYWILGLFPSVCRSFDPTWTMILPPPRPAELPFLPNSAWMRDGTIRIAEDATGETNNFETLKEKEGQSLDNAGTGPSKTDWRSCFSSGLLKHPPLLAQA